MWLEDAETHAIAPSVLFYLSEAALRAFWLDLQLEQKERNQWSVLKKEWLPILDKMYVVHQLVFFFTSANFGRS